MKNVYTGKVKPKPVPKKTAGTGMVLNKKNNYKNIYKDKDINETI